MQQGVQTAPTDMQTVDITIVRETRNSVRRWPALR